MKSLNSKEMTDNSHKGLGQMGIPGNGAKIHKVGHVSRQFGVVDTI
jgi:hypothetical protein